MAMRLISLFSIALVAPAVLGCGGRPVKVVNDGSAPSDVRTEPADSGRDGAAIQDSSQAVNALKPIDGIDNPDGGLTVPPGSASFFWQPTSNTWAIGNWFLVSSDATLRDARPQTIVPPRGESTTATHVSGANQARGADLWLQLDHPGGRPLDLRAYSGFAFWARVGEANGKVVVAVNDRDSASFFSARAGQQPLPARTVTVSDQWEHFMLPFTDFGIDGSSVAGFDFIVGEGGEPYDLWIDDIALVCRSSCP